VLKAFTVRQPNKDRIFVLKNGVGRKKWEKGGGWGFGPSFQEAPTVEFYSSIGVENVPTEF